MHGLWHLPRGHRRPVSLVLGRNLFGSISMKNQQSSAYKSALEFLATQYAQIGETRNAEAIRKGFLSDHEKIAVRALEQALTQQHALSSPRQEGDSTAARTQGLRELASEWRRKVREHFGYGPSGQALLYCAAELEALLTSPTTGADGVSP